jgi:hypothetical protein
MVQLDMAEEVTQHLMVEGLTFEPDQYDFDPNNWVLSSFEDNTAVDEDSPALPTGFSLSSAYPNPFNSTAVIEYNIPYQSEINLAVYNQLGQMVQVLSQGSQGAGTQTAVLYGTDLPTGLYFIRLEGAGVILMKKIVLMK